MKSKIILASVLMLSMGLSSFAQTLNEVIETYNKAGAYFNEGKYADALKTYEQTLKICTQVGDSALEFQIKVEQTIPLTYYNIGKGFFDAKNYKEAITNFELSIKFADKVGDTKTTDKSRAYLAGIYISFGNNDYKNDTLDAAIEKFNIALSYKPGYYKAYYGLGLVYKKQENLPLMKESLDKAISMAGDDAKTIGNAKDAMTSAYQKAGAVALQASKYSVAVENLLASQVYNNTEPRTYFYLAIAYNGLSKWDDAIAAANKALELQTEDKSDIYFELGNANEKKGDAAAACDNYKKVTAGNNVAAAKYQIEQVLKCK
ncbi:MAG: tetratricopeptide repeat protein [Bacteroidales bacterium]|nr:tetratricopeptide repeat protein [Bacteroidales bacterium]